MKQENEICIICGELTGNAGKCEDSIYRFNKKTNHEDGPLCESCSDMGEYLGLFSLGE
jgi:hypothetical protein